MISSHLIYPNTPSFGRIGPYSLIKDAGDGVLPHKWIDLNVNPQFKDSASGNLDPHRVEKGDIIAFSKEQQQKLKKIKTLCEKKEFTNSEIAAAQAYALDPELGKKKLAKVSIGQTKDFTLLNGLYLNGLVECVQYFFSPDNFGNLDIFNFVASAAFLGARALSSTMSAIDYRSKEKKIAEFFKEHNHFIEE